MWLALDALLGFMPRARQPSIMLVRAASFLLLSVVVLAGCQSNQRVLREQHAELTTLMTGRFDSSAQHARATDDYFDISLSMTPIWPELTTDEQSWFYVEQAMSAALNRPYRQRIYRVAPLPADKHVEIARPGQSEKGKVLATFVSEVYKIPNQQAYINAAGDPARFAGLTPDMLERLAGCDVLLARTSDNTFEGGTQGDGCASSLRGATYVTSEVLIAPTGLRTWDRGFDKEGKYVWGAEKGPYEFMRLP